MTDLVTDLKTAYPPRMTEAERAEWSWDYLAQNYIHTPCEASGHGASTKDRRCGHCNFRNPNYFIWDDVMDFIKFHKLDQDEYFMAMSQDDIDKIALPSRQVWTENTAKLFAYWVIGNNEGYYVHVSEIEKPLNGRGQTPKYALRLLGKFWTQSAAEKAVLLLQDFLNKSQYV